MKNLLLILVFLSCSIQWASAQDYAAFNHYVVQPVLINPAATGFSEKQTLMMNMRNQWTGFPNAPKTYAVSYNGPIGRTLGLGASLLSENIASITRQRFQLNYAFRYQVKDVKLGVGFNTEFHNMRLTSSTMSNPLVDQQDQLVQDAIDGVKIFDASLGFYGTIRDQTFIGLAFPNLILTKIGDIETGGGSEGAFFRYFNFNLGHKFDLVNEGVTLTPSLLVRNTYNEPFMIDFNLMGGFLNDQLYAGLSYRAGTGGDLGILLGGKVSVFKVYYSFDLGLGQFQQYSSGSHELTFAFEFSKWNKTEYEKNKGKRR